jgi:hypothetical protein
MKIPHDIRLTAAMTALYDTAHLTSAIAQLCDLRDPDDDRAKRLRCTAQEYLAKIGRDLFLHEGDMS